MASKPHLEALVQLEQKLAGRFKVCGVLDYTFSKAEQVAAEHDWHAYKNIDEIIKDEEVTCVDLITPPDQRQAYVEALANAGKHILTEKPIERTYENALKIVECCEQADVNLAVMFQHRFRSGSQKLRELTDSGALGDITSVRSDIPWWRPQSYYDVPGRGTYARDGGGVLISQAIHQLDLMLSLTGPAKEVQALCAQSAVHQLEAENFATGGIRFVSGAVGSVVATTATFPGSTESLVIDGTKGTAILEGGQLKLFWRDGQTEEIGEVSGTGGGADPMAFPCDWHRDLIQDFIESIEEKRQPRTSGREGLRVHALLDALVKSSVEGKLMEVSQG